MKSLFIWYPWQQRPSLGCKATTAKNSVSYCKSLISERKYNYWMARKKCNSKLTDMRQEVPHYSRRYFSLGERFCMLSKCQNYLFLIIHAWTTHALIDVPSSLEELVLDELLCKAKSNLKSTHSGQFWKPTKNQFFSRGTMAKLEKKR